MKKIMICLFGHSVCELKNNVCAFNLVIVLLIAAFFAKIPTGWASNFDELVASTISGGNPYRLVVSDSRNPSAQNSALAPGIYVRGEGDGSEWIPALLGNFMTVPLRGGFSLQLSMTSATNRFESVAVKDGKVCFFHVKSRLNHIDSYGLLGEGDWKVVDALTHQEIHLPPVTDLRDMFFYEYDANEEYSIVFVSQKHANSKGNGYTVAIVLKKEKVEGPNGDEVKFKPVFNPTIVDYSFIDNQESQARSVVDRSNLGVISRVLLQHYSIPRKNDSELFRRWRLHLKEQLEPGARWDMLTLGGLQSLPLVDATTGQLDIVRLPSEIMMASGIVVGIYAADPIHGKEGLFFEQDKLSLAAIEHLQPDIAGAVAVNEENQYDVHSLSLKNNNDSLLIRMADGRIYLVGKSEPRQPRVDVLPLRFHSENREVNRSVRGVSYFVINRPSGSNPQSYWLLVSRRYEGDSPTHHLGTTDLYELGASRIGLKVERIVHLKNQFYSRSSLMKRIHEVPKFGMNVFDAHTEVEENDSNYDQLHAMTNTHVNINATLSDQNQTGAVKYIIPDPLEVRVLGPKLEYHVYRSFRDVSSVTGLYFTRENQRELIVSGELLIPTTFPNGQNSADHVSLNIHGTGMTGLNLFLVDTMNLGGKGANGFNLVLAGGAESSVAPVVAHLFNNDPLKKVDVNKIKYARFITNLPGHINAEKVKPDASVPVIVAVAFEGGPTRIIYLILQSDGKLGFKVLDAVFREVSDQYIPLPEVQSRLLFDEHGMPLWLKTPNLMESHLEYKLTRIIQGGEYEPNRASGARPTFRPLSALKPDGSSNGSPNSSFFTTSWQMHPHDRRYQELVEPLKYASEYQVDIFDQMRNVIEDISNPTKSARKIVLLVPKELKNYCEKYPLALRSREINRPDYWSDQNSNLKFFMIDVNRADQNQVLSNLNQMRDYSSAGGTRAVLYSTLAQVHQVGTPRTVSDGGRTQPFELTEHVSSFGVDGAMNAGTFQSGQAGLPSGKAEKFLPSLSYLIATEGRTMDLAEFRSSPPESSISSLFIGTEEEWKTVKDKAMREGKYGLFDTFQVISLDAPTTEVRENYILQLLRRPEIRSFGYKLSLEGLMQVKAGQTNPNQNYDIAEIERRLARYIVTQAQTLSLQNNIPVFEGFMKVYNNLARELVENSRVRERRIIDRRVIERVMSKHFSMPINVAYLDDDDFMSIFYSHGPGQAPGDAAVFKLIQVNYYGKTKLTRDVIRVLLRQLNADRGKQVPSSMIFYGTTGKGKTYLIESLFKVGKIKTYDFKATATEANLDAKAFFVRMRDVYDNYGPQSQNGKGTNRGADAIALSEVMEHLDRFLASENGHRGFIVLDDIHNAAPSVKAAFLGRLRGLLESPTYTAKTSTGTIVERPTRNLIPILTLNPISDDSELTVEKQIIKSLTTTEFPVEASLLARFGQIFNFDDGGRESGNEGRGPQLVDTTKDAIRSLMQNDSRLAMVSSRAIEDMSLREPAMNIRDYLSGATRALTQPIRDMQGSLFIVTPTRRNQKAYGLESNQYDFINLSDEGNVLGRLESLKYIAENFRKRIYYMLTTSMQAHPAFSGSMLQQQDMGAPFAQALFRQINQHTEMQLDQFSYDPIDFDVTDRSDFGHFQDVLRSEIQDQRARIARLPLLLKQKNSNAAMNAAGTQSIGGYPMTPLPRTRQDVMLKYINLLTQDLKKILLQATYLQNFDQLPDAEEWLRRLPMDELRIDGMYGPKMMGLVLEFMKEMTDQSLLENQPGNRTLLVYDVMRLFAYCLDKALHKLPWSRAMNFLIQVQKQAVMDLSVGQSASVQNYLFRSAVSPLVPIDVGVVKMYLQSVPSFSFGNEEAQHNQYLSECERLLTGE